MPDAPDKSHTRPQPDELDAIQRVSFDCFLKECNRENGLVADRSQPGSPASIAVTGLGISIYIAAAKRNVLSRAEAAARVLSILRFFNPVHMDRSPMRPGTKASTTTSSICRAASFGSP